MKIRFLATMALLSMVLTANAQTDISLDGKWQMTIADKEYTVQVPHTYNMMEGLEDYAGEVVYKKALPVKADLKGRTVRLHFEAVYHDAIVFVNGQKVGEHIGNGQEQTITLPDMEPDKSYSFVLKNINAQYAFEIQRPGEYKVIEY